MSRRRTVFFWVCYFSVWAEQNRKRKKKMEKYVYKICICSIRVYEYNTFHSVQISFYLKLSSFLVNIVRVYVENITSSFLRFLQTATTTSCESIQKCVRFFFLLIFPLLWTIDSSSCYLCPFHTFAILDVKPIYGTYRFYTFLFYMYIQSFIISTLPTAKPSKP